MVVETKCGKEMCSLISGICECKLFDDGHPCLTLSPVPAFDPYNPKLTASCDKLSESRMIQSFLLGSRAVASQVPLKVNSVKSDASLPMHLTRSLAELLLKTPPSSPKHPTVLVIATSPES